jgi:hypothetical protein
MKPEPDDLPPAEESSLLILADGRVLARNVTPALAALLLPLQPESADLAHRARLSPKIEKP